MASKRRSFLLAFAETPPNLSNIRIAQWCLTLYTYISCGRSLRETSARLCTHRNTILYRIRKLKEDYDIPLDDPNLMMSLLVSSGLALLEQGYDAPFLPVLDLDEPDE